MRELLQERSELVTARCELHRFLVRYREEGPSETLYLFLKELVNLEF